MRTPGWKGNRAVVPFVQVRPVCKSCNSRLVALAPGQIPVRAGEDVSEFRVVTRKCRCGHDTRIKVREVSGE